ncbi:F-Box Only Protein 46 [Manis pentadactyla]|nr:F-Box Only Protein 46 [Manis pentadactyla]
MWKGTRKEDRRGAGTEEVRDCCVLRHRHEPLAPKRLTSHRTFTLSLLSSPGAESLVRLGFTPGDVSP